MKITYKTIINNNGIQKAERKKLVCRNQKPSCTQTIAS